MHSSKGFYTKILVTDESHSVTAVWPVMISVYALYGICLHPGKQWPYRQDSDHSKSQQWVKPQSHGLVSKGFLKHNYLKKLKLIKDSSKAHQ